MKAIGRKKKKTPLNFKKFKLIPSHQVKSRHISFFSINKSHKSEVNFVKNFYIRKQNAS